MLLDLHIFCLISVQGGVSPVHCTRAWPKLLLCFLFISLAIMLDDITKTTSKAIEAQLRLSIANSRTSSSSSSNSGGSCSNESSSSSSNSTVSSVRLPPSDTKATKLAASRYRPTVCLQPTLPASPVAATFSAAGSCHSATLRSLLCSRAHIHSTSRIRRVVQRQLQFAVVVVVTVVTCQ